MMAGAGDDSDEGFEPDERTARTSRLASLLQSLRPRLDRFEAMGKVEPNEAADWDALLYAYDDALVAVADLLDVDVPPAARDDLTYEDRVALEAALASAGLDVREGGDQSPRPER